MPFQQTKRFLHSLSDPLATFGKVLGVSLFLLILFAPSPENLSPPAQRLAAVTVLMASLWFTQAMPIAATALIPLFAFPLLGIQPAEIVSKSYMNKNIFLFLGGFIIALGIEKWGLHKRIALHIVHLIGTSLRKIILAFMLATGFLSMWISNTASSLLMLPIGLAILVSLKDLVSEQSHSKEESEKSQAALKHFSIVLMLAIAYSASIGGLMTLVGTPTNITFIDIWETTFPKAPEIATGKWMLAVMPFGCLFLLLTWAILVFRLPKSDTLNSFDRSQFSKQISQLGKMNRAEWLMLIIFVSTALLWITRADLTFGSFTILNGWGAMAAKKLVEAGVPEEGAQKWIHDSTVAMGMAVLMFAIPAGFKTKSNEKKKHIEYLMDWKTAEKLPWGILLLFGGGFAIAGAFQGTGLSEWVGEFFAQQTAGWSLWLIILSVCFMMTFLTEFTSNVATVSALLPVLAATAAKMEIDPRLLMIPATISASCAFMLPIATPPNAIVFGSGHLPMGSMIRYGIVLNLLGVVLITICTYLFFIPVFNIQIN